MEKKDLREKLVFFKKEKFYLIRDKWLRPKLNSKLFSFRVKGVLLIYKAVRDFAILKFTNS